MSSNFMLPSVTDLTEQQEKAAQLQAESELSVEAIAAKVGVTRQSLWRWNDLPAYRRRIKEINTQLDSEAYRTTLARRRNRVVKLADMANLLEERIRASPQNSTSMVREWRGLLEQIARELGQWTDKLDINGEVAVSQIQVREVVIELTEDKHREVVEAEFAPVAPALSPAQRIERTLVPPQPEPISEPAQPAVVPNDIEERRRLIAQNEQRQQDANWFRQADDWV